MACTESLHIQCMEVLLVQYPKEKKKKKIFFLIGYIYVCFMYICNSVQLLGGSNVVIVCKQYILALCVKVAATC